MLAGDAKASAVWVGEVQEDGIDVELPDMDSLIGKIFSGEHIDKKFTYLLGDNENKE